MKLTESYKNRLKTLSGIVTENGNIRPHGRYDYLTLESPIIPDGIELLSQYPNAIKFNDKTAFKNYLDSQKYFSASYSHCFYTEQEHAMWSKNGSKYSDADSPQSIMMFETGHELMAVWDNKNSIGYVIPSKRK